MDWCGEDGKKQDLTPGSPGSSVRMQQWCPFLARPCCSEPDSPASGSLRAAARPEHPRCTTPTGGREPPVSLSPTLAPSATAAAQPEAGMADLRAGGADPMRRKGLGSRNAEEAFWHSAAKRKT